MLDRAAALLKPGGRIAYVTCSVLAEENGDQVRAFPAPPPGFRRRPAGRGRRRRSASARYLFRRAVLIRRRGC